jgi:uroporphyrinogen-III synthase
MALVVLIPSVALGCARGDDTASSDQPTVSTEGVRLALTKRGFETTVAPTPSGSGIEDIILVTAPVDDQIEIAVFLTRGAAESYRAGLQEAGYRVKPLVMNVMVLLDQDAVPASIEQRLDSALAAMPDG